MSGRIDGENSAATTGAVGAARTEGAWAGRGAEEVNPAIPLGFGGAPH